MTARRLTSREDGVGTFGSILGGVIILTLVLLATHVLLALQRRSVVNAVAFDVARSVARNGAMTVAEAGQQDPRQPGSLTVGGAPGIEPAHRRKPTGILGV